MRPKTRKTIAILVAAVMILASFASILYLF